jgi:hypothetical protein
MKKIFNKTYTPLQLVIDGVIYLLGARETILTEKTNTQIDNLVKKNLLTVRDVK